MSILPQSLTQPFISQFNRWFAKRAPKSDSATLNLRNVYIFFSREGLLFALLLLITFVAGINYANNLVLGLCFYLISVWLISFHVTFAHISGLQVRLLEVTMAAAGEPVWVTLQLTNDSRQPRRQLLIGFEQASLSSLKTAKSSNFIKSAKSAKAAKAAKSTKANKTDQADESVAKIPTQLLLPRLQKEQTIRLSLPTTHRGELELPRLQIKTVYPLGIMRAWSYVYFARSAWVYPKPEKFEWPAQYLLADAIDIPTGGQYAQGQDDFDRLDNYIEGESLARVSWGHVARGQGMFTKHFAAPIGRKQRLAYADMPAITHEQKLAQMAYGVLTLGALEVPFEMQFPEDIHTSSASDIEMLGQGESFAQACLLRLAKAP